jgi:Xaa-Pro aminopeptidase
VAGEQHAGRRAALAAQLEREGLGALLVTHPPNVRYLTGFTGSAGFLLLSPTQATLVTDFRYATQAPQEAAGVDVQVERVNLWDRLGRLLTQSAAETLGIEAGVLTVRDAERVGGLTRARIVPSSDLVERLRASKSPEEVATIRAAATLAHEALAEILPGVRAGRRELDIASELEAALRRRGSEWHPFPTIVASGPRAALPHARSSEREVRTGEFVLIDFGAQVDGYCSDITRTVAVGRVDDRQRTVYDLVAEAQLRARTHVRAGMPGREADALARDVIAARGFGEAFGHSLGHGIGLEVHEGPRLSQTSEAPLPASAVVTVEPGVYLPGWSGVRIEDDVHLGPDGAVLLSDGRTELIEIT